MVSTKQPECPRYIKDETALIITELVIRSKMLD